SPTRGRPSPHATDARYASTADPTISASVFRPTPARETSSAPSTRRPSITWQCVWKNRGGTTRQGATAKRSARPVARRTAKSANIGKGISRLGDRGDLTAGWDGRRAHERSALAPENQREHLGARRQAIL